MERKTLLILASRFPYPVVGGDKLFLMNVSRALADRHRLTLLCFCESKQEMRYQVTGGPFAEIHRVYLPKWRSYWNSLAALPTKQPLQLAYYDSQEFWRKAGELIPKHDAVLAHLIRTAPYVDGVADTPTILLMADAISLNYERISKLGDSYSWKNTVYWLEQKRLFEYERSISNRFCQTWLHSDVDREFLGIPASASHIRRIPMGIDLEDFPFNPNANGNKIVFIGNMASAQNQDACFYFIDHILPLVREKADVCFRVVGNAPHRVKTRLESHRFVEVTGRVDSIAAHVQHSFCGVCSVRAGAGVQNKVLNYFALGLPCVTSHVGLEGIDARPGEEILVFDSPADAAHHIAELFGNRVLRKAIARRARVLLERQYSWTTIYPRIRSEVDSLFECCNAARTPPT